MKIIRKWFHCACIVIVIFSFVTFSVSLPADVLWDSFVTQSFLPVGEKWMRDKWTPKDVCGEANFQCILNKKNLKKWKKKTVTIQVLKINQGTKFEIWLFFHCLKLLFNVLLVQLHKYGHAGKQGSKSVAPCFGFYGTQVRLHMIFWAHNQKSSRICDQLVVNFEPDPLRSSISLKLFTDKLLVFKRSRAQV